jgi:hypothetical protein
MYYVTTQQKNIPYHFRIFKGTKYWMPFFFSRNPDTKEELKSIRMQSVAPKKYLINFKIPLFF